MEAITLSLIAKILGEPYTNVDRWVKRWELEPSIRLATGRGAERLYSRADAVACIVGSLLQKGGIDLEFIRKAIRLCQKSDFDALVKQGKCFLVPSNEPRFVTKNAAFINLSPNQQTQLLTIVNVGGVLAKLDNKLREVARQLEAAVANKTAPTAV